MHCPEGGVQYVPLVTIRARKTARKRCRISRSPPRKKIEVLQCRTVRCNAESCRQCRKRTRDAVSSTSLGVLGDSWPVVGLPEKNAPNLFSLRSMESGACKTGNYRKTEELASKSGAQGAGGACLPESVAGGEGFTAGLVVGSNLPKATSRLLELPVVVRLGKIVALALTGERHAIGKSFCAM